MLTVMPSPPSSDARLRVRPSIPALDALYPGRPIRPTCDMIEPTLTMRPQPRCRMLLAHSRESTNGPTRFARSTCSNSAVANSSSVWRRLSPALLTRMSILPCSATSAATAATHCTSSPTSNATAEQEAAGFLSSRRRRASSTVAGLVPVRTVCAPCAASASAMAKPMPREAPVTSATLPSSGSDGEAWANVAAAQAAAALAAARTRGA
mmetsp:Transcript_23308/g.74661  ORF Transcript_23308/g.74661 Transcript_23308/m.74661 type:complete len:209 (-) Transcript_23308:6-632(-)